MGGTLISETVMISFLNTLVLPEVEGNFLMLIMTIIVMTMMMIYRDQQLTRYKRGFTTSAGGHLLPLHNHNLWRELVGWRLSTGEGWREERRWRGKSNL